MPNNERTGSALSQEQAEQEVADINAEIAKSKGLDPATGQPLKKSDDEGDNGQDEHQTKDDESDTSDDKKDDEEDKESKDDEKGDDDKGPIEDKSRKSPRMVPLKKYQELTTKLDTIESEKDRVIADLTEKLNQKQTADQRKQKLEQFAEKMGYTDEQRDAFMETIGDLTKPDPAIVKSIERVEKLSKRAEAEAAFDAEFDRLLKRFPDAEEHYATLQEKAWNPKNLTTPLIEIYLDEVKQAEKPAGRKTAESSRSGNRSAATQPGVIDFAKVLKDIQANIPNALGKLSPDDQDKFFEWAEKQPGSHFVN